MKYYYKASFDNGNIMVLVETFERFLDLANINSAAMKSKIEEVVILDDYTEWDVGSSDILRLEKSLRNREAVHYL